MRDLLDPLWREINSWAIRTGMKPHPDGFTESELDLADSLALSICRTAISSRRNGSADRDAQGLIFEIGETIFHKVDVMTHSDEWFELYNLAKSLGEDDWQVELGVTLLRRAKYSGQIALDALQMDPSENHSYQRDRILRAVLCDELLTPVTAEVLERVESSFRVDPHIVRSDRIRREVAAFLDASN